MEYKELTVVITGGAKGIGAACAKRFHEEGANVAILDLSTDDDHFSVHSWYYQRCDVSDEQQVKTAITRIIARFGRIDLLVNNAGIQRYGTVTETSSAEWDLVMNVNLKSMFLCAHYTIPHMLQQQKGVVINIASVQAFVSQQKVAAYTTAKTAILGLTRSIAVDYAPQIRAVAVCPGTIDTPMLRDAIALSPAPGAVMEELVDMHLSHRIGKPDEVANLVLFLCSDKAAFITGQAIRIDGGIGVSIPGSKKESI